MASKRCPRSEAAKALCPRLAEVLLRRSVLRGSPSGWSHGVSATGPICQFVDSSEPLVVGGVRRWRQHRSLIVGGSISYPYTACTGEKVWLTTHGPGRPRLFGECWVQSQSQM